jgi:hypothetical protein
MNIKRTEINTRGPDRRANGQFTKPLRNASSSSKDRYLTRYNSEQYDLLPQRQLYAATPRGVIDVATQVAAGYIVSTTM